jgi:hypothetical protein
MEMGWQEEAVDKHAESGRGGSGGRELRKAADRRRRRVNDAKDGGAEGVALA